MTSSPDASPIVVAADGSALGNPGPAGWAWYVDETCWSAGGWAHGTNNMGELKAVLDLVESTAAVPERELRILCDSQYVINCITKWMPGWKKKGWKKKDGKPVMNRDLLEALDAALAGRKYTFEWVKGHAGHPLNEAADVRARGAAEAYQAKREPDRGPGFPSARDAGIGNADAESVGTGGDGSGDAGSASAATGTSSTRRQEPRSVSGPDPTAAEISAPRTSGSGSTADPAAVEDAVLARERALNDPSVHTSHEDLERMLATDLTWVTTRGRLVNGAAAKKYPEQAFGLVEEPEYLRTRKLSDGSVLVLSRVRGARGTLLRSSVWALDSAGSWVLSARQETAES